MASCSRSFRGRLTISHNVFYCHFFIHADFSYTLDGQRDNTAEGINGHNLSVYYDPLKPNTRNIAQQWLLQTPCGNLYLF